MLPRLGNVDVLDLVTLPCLSNGVQRSSGRVYFSEPSIVEASVLQEVICLSVQLFHFAHERLVLFTFDGRPFCREVFLSELPILIR